MNRPYIKNELPALDLDACRARQKALCVRLKELKIEAAIIGDLRHVHYFTGYWCRSMYAPLLLLAADGSALLAVPATNEFPVASDKVVVYQSNHLATLVDHQRAAALGAISNQCSKWKKLASDIPPGRGINAQNDIADLSDVMFSLRRFKHPDEIALLQVGIAASEKAYAYALENLKPGITELELYAQMHAQAVQHVGEPIGEFGNDFQIGALGSRPRLRAAEAGEIAILDLTVVVRGYASDMCRSFVVGGMLSPSQTKALDRIREVHAVVEKLIVPGFSCSELYQRANEMLDGYEGWSFKHHVGHGIGLSNHEAPRINSHWNDTLQIGDVITIEPGLYGADLRAGLRIEEIYHLSATGPKKLTTFPTNPA